jgi:ribosomal protein S12 methylthiotransferase accessory factor
MSESAFLKDAPKGYTMDLDKLVSPEETVRRFKDRLKTVNLDILEETVRIDNGRLDIPVYFSVCGRDAEAVIGTKKQMGKGGTAHQAEASAVMELAERFSLFSFYGDRSKFIVEQYGNIRDRALPFELIARSVHDESDDLERAVEAFSRLPLMWTSAYNLTRQEETLIPFNWFFTINQFNGSSAGNCLEEAVLQGICEVVERHVSSIISRGRLSTPGIELASITDPLSLELIEKFRRQDIQIRATDFSLDTGIPTVGVLAWDPSTFPGKSEIVWTAGTTTSPEKSLIRALTEVAQLAGDFNTCSNYVASGLPKFRDLSEADFIVDSKGEVPISSLPDISDDNIRVEAERCVGALSGTGMEVILVDVTDSRLALPAVYSIIPGAHFRERAAGTSLGMFSAKLLAESGDPEWAIGELEEVNRLLPGKYYVRFFLGLCLIELGRPEEALVHLRDALNLEPQGQDIPSIYSYMGVCLKDLEQYDAALRVLERAETYDHERPDIYNLMGFCHFKLKEHEKAIDCFKKVIEINPASAIDYANIASNYRDMGDREQAVRYYRLALELDPTIEFARENLMKLEKN